MSMRIYTMTHKKFTPLPDPLYVPLHVGRACGENLGYLGDDTGEQISALNCYYSELTGFYWIWKNCHDADYVGTCHYRRYLINEKEQIYTEKEYRELLRKYDLVTTKKVLLNNSYYDGFLANHNIRALEMTGKVITEKYPEYADAFEQLVNGRQTYFGNILVTSKILFDEYASWLFSIFFEVAERIELETGEDAYHKRVFGYQNLVNQKIYDMALDSLISTIGRCEEYSSDAKELGCEGEISDIQAKAEEALEAFKIDTKKALEVYDMKDRTAYSKEIYQILDDAGLSEE